MKVDKKPSGSIRKRTYISIAIFIVAIALLALAYGAVSIRTFRIESTNMEPTLKRGDIILGHLRTKPELNKIVIYKTNNQQGRTVGRILGVPNQTINFETNYKLPDGTRGTTSPYTLKSDEYYIAGDNPSNRLPVIIKAHDIIAVQLYN